MGWQPFGGSSLLGGVLADLKGMAPGGERAACEDNKVANERVAHPIGR